MSRNRNINVVATLNRLLEDGVTSIMSMMLLGTDIDACSKNCVVINIKEENGRAKIVTAHAGPRSDDDGELWRMRDDRAAEMPNARIVVFKFFTTTKNASGQHSNVVCIKANTSTKGLVNRWGGYDDNVQMCINILNKTM